MPQLFIYDNTESITEDGLLVNYPDNYLEIFNETTGTFIIATEKLWNLRELRLGQYPHWEFIRFVSESTPPNVLEAAQKCASILPNYRIEYLHKPIAEVTSVNESIPEPPIEELFQPLELTPIPQFEPEIVFDSVVPVPQKTLIIADRSMAGDLLKSLFTKSGKSIRARGKNHLVCKSDDLETICRSEKKYGFLTTSKLSDWDAPDILDEFRVIVYSREEIPLPTCEGYPHFFSFNSLSELDDVYSFMGLERE